ncbi:hypothetical protein [Streptomyces sp900129855]|uniref:Uncharacterized protein n=1 Tax=Streptomyces sp. 900129855 TaxID=3155129 RepID=A0ABV2ZLF2_9ACTN
MPPSTPDRTDQALRHRQLAVAAVNQAHAQYEIALLDHVTARVLDALPEATHLTFDFHTHSREAELHAVWATHHHGTEELLLDARRDTDITGLDLVELGDDLTDTLAGLDSAAWSSVRPMPRPDKRWVLDLPPADRAGRIAELVRGHHPEARLLTIDVSRNPCRVTGMTLVDADGLPQQISASDSQPLWPAATEQRITAFARQIHALPHLRAQHLARIGGPQDRTAFLLLPETGSASATGTKKELS